MGAKKLRRKSLPKHTKTGVAVETAYCRKCMQMKKPLEFFMATDFYLDSNGLLSVCKTCISAIYVKYYNVEHSLDRAIYRLCRLLNIKFDESALRAVKTHLTTQSKADDDPTVFGLYKSKIISRGEIARGEGSTGIDLTFVESKGIPEQEPASPDDFEDPKTIFEFWGEGFTTDEYRFLEKEFNNFRRTHKADTYSEIILLKEVCYKMLEIQRARKEDKSTGSAVKELQTLMTSLAISPNMANVANSGRGVEAFGNWIKDIENLTPAEWVDDKSIYKDVDDIEAYAELHITRPLKNFITGSRDFGTEEISEIFDADETEE